MGIVIAAIVYLVPTIIAVSRYKTGVHGSAIVVNILLGWTIIGWVIALAMSVKTRKVAVINK